MIPPNRERMERFILVQSPISAILRAWRCKISSCLQHIRPDVRRIRSGGFNSRQKPVQIGSITVHRYAFHSIGAVGGVSSHALFQCHDETAFPANEFPQVRYNNCRGLAEEWMPRRLHQGPCHPSQLRCLLVRTKCRHERPVLRLYNVLSGIARIRCDDTSRRSLRPIQLELTQSAATNCFKD